MIENSDWLGVGGRSLRSVHGVVVDAVRCAARGRDRSCGSARRTRSGARSSGGGSDPQFASSVDEGTVSGQGRNVAGDCRAVRCSPPITETTPHPLPVAPVDVSTAGPTSRHTAKRSVRPAQTPKTTSTCAHQLRNAGATTRRPDQQVSSDRYALRHRRTPPSTMPVEPQHETRPRSPVVPGSCHRACRRARQCSSQAASTA